MKIGSVVRLFEPLRSIAAINGWLWVYEGKPTELDNRHRFKAVATGETGFSGAPGFLFQNWEEENENR
jgi:hypothetical protein